MSGAFGLAGFHFGNCALISACVGFEHFSDRDLCSLIGRKPTSSSSEAPVSMAQGTMPWQVSSAKGEDAEEHFKYQYHPGGDKSKAPKDAPSALHSVIVPNVNLPKVSLTGIDGSRFRRTWQITSDRSYMRSTINGERTDTKDMTNS